MTTCPEGSPANRWHGEYPRFGVIEDYLGYGPAISYGAGLSTNFRFWAYATKIGNRWEFEQTEIDHYYYDGSWYTNTYVGYIEGYAQE